MYASQAAEFKYTQQDLKSGELFLIDCEIGDKIIFTLRSNPTTGYQWLVPQVKFNDFEVYEFKSGLFQKDQTNDDRVGVGGTIEFTFTAIKSGENILQLVEARPWTVNDLAKDDTGYYDVSNLEANEFRLKFNVIGREDL